MKLLGDRILCKQIVEKKETTSGLILPDNYNSENEFEVLEVGVNVKHLKAGSRIRKFKNSEGIPIVVNDFDCLILSEEGDVEFVVSL